ncbi:MAG: hypothetical protein JW771_00740 [Candidatus Thermoplasmatota archaeon]|nr:hypothetical protein [Candidatus Thermoplasmatota archaeon]
MIKKRMYSAHHDFRTGFLYKLLVIVGAILLVIYLIEQASHLLSMDVTVQGSILAFAILCIGGGVLAFFISSQFSKLAKIADDVECGKETK